MNEPSGVLTELIVWLGQQVWGLLLWLEIAIDEVMKYNWVTDIPPHGVSWEEPTSVREVRQALPARGFPWGCARSPQRILKPD